MNSAKGRATVGTDSSVDRGAVYRSRRVKAFRHPSASSFRAQHVCDQSPDAFTRNPKTPRGITQDPNQVNPFLQVAR